MRKPFHLAFALFLVLALIAMYATLSGCSGTIPPEVCDALQYAEKVCYYSNELTKYLCDTTATRTEGIPLEAEIALDSLTHYSTKLSLLKR